MNIPSFHQHDLFNELSKIYEDFEVIFAHKTDENRRNQGWDYDDAVVYESKTIGVDLNLWRVILYVFKNRKATHIINGIWAEKWFLFVILLLNTFSVNFLIYSEAPAPTKQRGLVKRIMLRFIVKPFSKLLVIRAKGFFAVSIFAVAYFESLGIKNNKIYRFGYFRNVKKTAQNQSNSKGTELLFIGQLIQRKGITSLLEALKIVDKSHKNFHLTIIGMGVLESLLKEFTKKNQLQNTVTFLGTVNSSKIPAYIEKADLLILPSVFDGWGMVVNEALQCHIPVLISDQCGAKELVKHNRNGFIFQHDNPESLKEYIQKFLSLSLAEKHNMKYCAGEMGEKINIKVVSNYLRLCVEHCLNSENIKPVAPWLND